MTAPEVVPIALKDGRIRVVIEQVTPCVDGGRFAVKRVVGDAVSVEADCFADGHDTVACAVQWRHGDGEWRSTLMQPLGNDRWRATFDVDRIGRWQYAVRAWVDPFLSWRHDFERRVDLDDLQLAARAGALLIEQAAKRSRGGPDAKALKAWATELLDALGADADVLKALALDPVRSAIAERHPDLRYTATTAPLPLHVERLRARFSSWYEFFPRSASPDADRHGTFADCEARLPFLLSVVGRIRDRVRRTDHGSGRVGRRPRCARSTRCPQKSGRGDAVFRRAHRPGNGERARRLAGDRHA